MSSFGQHAAWLGLWSISACAGARLPPKGSAGQPLSAANTVIAGMTAAEPVRTAVATATPLSVPTADLPPTLAAPITEPHVAPPPTVPSIRLHAEGTLDEWAFAATGFPALAKDGNRVVVAFAAQRTSGPPSLTLDLEIQSLDGAPRRRARFDEPYRGELATAALAQLRTRAEAWAVEIPS